MFGRLQLLTLLVATSALVQHSGAYYSGPFLFWGLDDLKDVQTSALAGLDDKALRDLYANAAAVVVFLRNGTTKLSEDNFPTFKRIVEQYAFVYSPQQMLSSNPLDYNVNAEIINLVGSPSQQDVELSALFRDSTENYGERKVLGILANQWEEPRVMHKREAKGGDDYSSTSTTPGSPTDEPEIADSIYNVPGKAILYITAPPVLRMLNDSDEGETIHVLDKHSLSTYDARERESKLIVTFKGDDFNKLTLKFRFDMDAGYWSMSKVDVFVMDTKSKDGSKTLDTTLELEGKYPPYAPLGASYSCARQLVFRNGSTILTLENIQVQPALEGKTKFDSAWDCVGFTTAPILSGIFVTSFMLIGLTVAILAILDIKPPNRFESRTGKQLTFTVQE
ncbi:AGAP001624-PA-like protein [Anopheles sinensis]|uniref:AGAP001624-PA-like protein n=1 Tax=Anopheles sinensis TaxID=74873 RepID=A0A084VWI9_ANOSI|nr:AGAP001624-PA-like protein [Anopheles sinensis]